MPIQCLLLAICWARLCNVLLSNKVLWLVLAEHMMYNIVVKLIDDSEQEFSTSI